MVPKTEVNLPGMENRVSAILRSKGLRDSLAALAGNHELAPTRALSFSSDLWADHLGKMRTVTDDEKFFDTRGTSEAIILATGRPVLLIQEGVVEKSTTPFIENLIKPVRKAFVRPINSVGRVELSDHDTFEWCGTAWRVDEDLLVTNRHVANVFAQRHGSVFKFRLNQAGKTLRARIDFREEYRGKESNEFGILEILWIADDSDTAPDMAVLRVRRDPGLPPPIKLAAGEPKTSQPIAVVGYPARDSRNGAALMTDIFGDIFDVKRFAPGEVRTTGVDTWYLTHDASTLGGNSGSAVFDLATTDVVGLHFGGSFRKTNFAVRVSTIKSILARKSWVDVTRASLSIPEEAFSEKVRTVASLKNRKGFAPGFLGGLVPVPKPGSTHAMLKTSLADNLLPYMHFSIMMSESRRFPIFTAENLDGSKKIKLKRKDSWGFDPRIPKAAQVGHSEFYGPEPFDKGHMVRRENPGWGDTEDEAQMGEDDSFVYTNAIPQMPQLNQHTWLSLENYVLDNARTEGFKVCVFTGPVFRSDDPSFSDIQVPTDFWKVVVALDSETHNLLASGYMLSQEGLMPEEGFRYGPFKTYQVPISRIEAVADLKFAKKISTADVFSGLEVTEMVRSARYVEITSSSDIVLTRKRK
jgi:endonuclease G, mitochondrial